MSHIEVKNVKGKQYYREVEKYRDDNGKVKHRILRYLGKECPKELNGTPLGFHGAKLTESKRVQVRFVELGAEDFFEQIGTIRKIINRKARVEFENAIRGRKDWTVSLDWLGNIIRGSTSEQ